MISILFSRTLLFSFFFTALVSGFHPSQRQLFLVRRDPCVLGIEKILTRPLLTTKNTISSPICSQSFNDLPIENSIKPENKKIKLRWVTGLSLGALGTLWIYSGAGIFMLGFLVTSLIALQEYYSMVKATGVEPATKTGRL